MKLLKVNKAQIVYPPDATLLLPEVAAGFFGLDQKKLYFFQHLGSIEVGSRLTLKERCWSTEAEPLSATAALTAHADVLY